MDFVKGVAFLGRRHAILQSKGEAAWDAYLKLLAAKVPFFKGPLLPSTAIPMGDYLKSQDLLVEHFYGGAQSAYAQLGVASADWSLVHGPYKVYAQARDIGGLVKLMPQGWHLFNSFGECAAVMLESEVSVDVSGLPLWHPSFEHLPMSYVGRTLELVSQKSVSFARKAGPARATSYGYIFTIG